MTKIAFLVLILIQGILMGSTLESIDVNGKKINIVYEQDSSLPVVYLKLVFTGSGSIADGNQIGVARFCSKILGEGSKTLGGVKFAQMLEERAIRFSSASGTETAVLDLSSLKEEFDIGIDAIVALLKEPNISKSSFEKVQASLIASSIKKEDDFDYIAESTLKASLFAKTPLASDGLGNKDSIKKIKLEDINTFFKEHYCKSNLIVTIGGDIDLASAKSKIKKIAEVLSNGTEKPNSQYKPTKISKDTIVKKDTKQAFVYFGAPLNTLATDSDVYKSKVASFILGSSGFGSRIMEEVRVKNGLAYSAYTRYNISKTNSYFGGYLQTKLENEEKAKDLVKKIIEDFVKNGATQKELDGARKFILGSEPLRNETLSQRLSRSFNEYYLGVGLGQSERELELIRNLDLKTLNDFITSHPEVADIGFAIVNAKGK